MFERIVKNLIPIVIVVGAISFSGALFYLNQGETGENTSDSQKIAQTAINYINENMLQEGTTASLVSVVEENGVYKFRLKIADQEYDSYVTKDGELLFTDGIKIIEASQTENQEEASSTEVPKRDIPDVKLFIMSYCPYGLQAEKMFLPVYDLLKDKTEMGIYFVNYIMHDKKEIDENLREYCIQKEQEEKYSNYLNCFVLDGDFEKCLSETNIDKTGLASCISETDEEYNITSQYNDKSTWMNESFPKFDIHTDLNEKYGVQGSPTVVINDKIVNISPRSPEKFKEIICQSFNSQPEECSTTLSSDASSAGFGGGSGSSSEGGCAE